LNTQQIILRKIKHPIQVLTITTNNVIANIILCTGNHISSIEAAPQSPNGGGEGSHSNDHNHQQKRKVASPLKQGHEHKQYQHNQRQIYCGKDVVAYAQLTSNENQLGNTILSFENVKGSERITVTGCNQTKIRVEESGVYFGVWTTQLGLTCSTDEVFSYVRVNGKDTVFSNSGQTQSRGQTSLLVPQLVQRFHRNDILQVVQYTIDTDGETGALALQSKDEPRAPSVLFSAIRVSSDGPYAQLVGSQIEYGTSGSVIPYDDFQDKKSVHRIRLSAENTCNNGVIEYEDGLYYIQTSL
ncbi:unnamed protein product, partial [Didymodactylos carnosus]